MSRTRHYARAPITEAIIDLRVELPEDKSVSDLESVHKGLETAYPMMKHRSLAVFHGEIGNQGAAAAASSKNIGFLLTSQDGKYIFQARLDGFTMSRLAPYENWEPFRDEARRLWNVYRAVAKPAKVTRLAVRFINRLDLALARIRSEGIPANRAGSVARFASGPCRLLHAASHSPSGHQVSSLA